MNLLAFQPDLLLTALLQSLVRNLFQVDELLSSVNTVCILKRDGGRDDVNQQGEAYLNTDVFLQLEKHLYGGPSAKTHHILVLPDPPAVTRTLLWASMILSHRDSEEKPAN